MYIVESFHIAEEIFVSRMGTEELEGFSKYFVLK